VFGCETAEEMVCVARENPNERRKWLRKRLDRTLRKEPVCSAQEDAPRDFQRSTNIQQTKPVLDKLLTLLQGKEQGLALMRSHLEEAMKNFPQRPKSETEQKLKSTLDHEEWASHFGSFRASLRQNHPSNEEWRVWSIGRSQRDLDLIEEESKQIADERLSELDARCDAGEPSGYPKAILAMARKMQRSRELDTAGCGRRELLSGRCSAGYCFSEEEITVECTESEKQMFNPSYFQVFREPQSLYQDAVLARESTYSPEVLSMVTDVLWISVLNSTSISVAGI
jgi:hypothetical protein